MKPYQVRVNSSRGAPMGRSGNDTEPQYPVKFHLQHVPMVDSCYDQGGAYWGMPDYRAGVYPLYCAWGDGVAEVQEVYIRAKSRDHARAEVLTLFPNAKFYR
jgi:hypothetical protein